MARMDIGGQFEWQGGGQWSSCIQFAAKAAVTSVGDLIQGSRPISEGQDISVPSFITCIQRVTEMLFSDEQIQRRFGLVAYSINGVNSTWCARVVTKDIECTYWDSAPPELPACFYTKVDPEAEKDPKNTHVREAQIMALTSRLSRKKLNLFPDFVCMYLLPDVRDEWLEEDSQCLATHWTSCTSEQKVWCRNECACARCGVATLVPE